MSTAAQIFISHTQEDRRFAEELSRALSVKGFDAFGPYGWEIGKPIDDQLRETLGSAGICVVLLSDKTLLSPWVFFELGAAIGGRKRLVLVYLSDRAWRDAPSSLRRAASIHATTLRPEEVADRVVEAAKAA